MQLNQVDLQMEVDTGAAVSVISEKTFQRLWPQESAPVLQPCSATLKTYTGETIQVNGMISVEASYQGQTDIVNLTITEGNGPSLLGHDWWKQLNHVQKSTTDPCKEVLTKHQELFKEQLGCVKGATAAFHIKPDATPKFCKARPVPYSL